MCAPEYNCFRWLMQKTLHVDLLPATLSVSLLSQGIRVKRKVKKAQVPHNRVSEPQVPTRTGHHLITHNSEIKLYMHLIDSKTLGNLLLATFFLLCVGIFLARVGLQDLFPSPLVLSGWCGRCEGVQLCSPLLGGCFVWGQSLLYFGKGARISLVAVSRQQALLRLQFSTSCAGGSVIQWALISKYEYERPLSSIFTYLFFLYILLFHEGVAQERTSARFCPVSSALTASSVLSSPDPICLCSCLHYSSSLLLWHVRVLFSWQPKLHFSWPGLGTFGGKLNF